MQMANSMNAQHLAIFVYIIKMVKLIKSHETKSMNFKVQKLDQPSKTGSEKMP